MFTFRASVLLLQASVMAGALATQGAAAQDGSTRCGGVRGKTSVATVSRAQARCPWPFSVQDIVLHCHAWKPSPAVIIEANGRRYALTESAVNWAKSAGVTTSALPSLLDFYKGVELADVSRWLDAGAELCRAE